MKKVKQKHKILMTCIQYLTCVFFNFRQTQDIHRYLYLGDGWRRVEAECDVISTHLIA